MIHNIMLELLPQGQLRPVCSCGKVVVSRGELRKILFGHTCDRMACANHTVAKPLPCKICFTATLSFADRIHCFPIAPGATAT